MPKRNLYITQTYEPEHQKCDIRIPTGILAQEGIYQEGARGRGGGGTARGDRQDQYQSEGAWQQGRDTAGGSDFHCQLPV